MIYIHWRGPTTVRLASTLYTNILLILARFRSQIFICFYRHISPPTHTLAGWPQDDPHFEMTVTKDYYFVPCICNNWI